MVCAGKKAWWALCKLPPLPWYWICTHLWKAQQGITIKNLPNIATFSFLVRRKVDKKVRTLMQKQTYLLFVTLPGCSHYMVDWWLPHEKYTKLGFGHEHNLKVCVHNYLWLLNSQCHVVMSPTWHRRKKIKFVFAFWSLWFNFMILWVWVISLSHKEKEYGNNIDNQQRQRLVSSNPNLLFPVVHVTELWKCHLENSTLKKKTSLKSGSLFELS